MTEEEALNDDQARQQCFKGKTIKPGYPFSQWAVLFFAFLLVIGVAISAYRALSFPKRFP